MRLLSLLILLLPLIGQSHPVSFKKGVGIMSYNDGQMNELLLTYSLTHWFAVATTYLKEGESEFVIPRLNFLLKRWNNEDSQGNVYLSGGSGVETYDNVGSESQLVSIVADWESRKYYTYFEHLYINRNNRENLELPQKYYNRSKLRLGFAPFLADYSDLNVWYIAQLDNSEDEDRVEATQFLRFYIKNVLWEVGASFNGQFAFNFMIHM